MDTKRNTVSHSEILASSIWESIVKNYPDIVVTMDDNALNFSAGTVPPIQYPKKGKFILAKVN